MELSSNCPKCNGHMERGFVVDHDKFPTMSEWTEGEAPVQYSIWSGAIKGVTRQVTTYRCTECGFLESYAK
jgi:hypothetical protein